MSEQKDTTLSDALASNYMLADLTVPVWGGTKTDTDLGLELAALKGAQRGATKVEKNLLLGADKELKETKAAYTRIRTWFYANTISMGRNVYAVPVTNVMKFLGTFATLKQQAEEARDRLVNAYEACVQQASMSLGAVFNPDDYPSKDKIAGRFNAVLDVRPMPAAQDFDRLVIPAKLAAGLKGLYERQAQAQSEAAVKDVQEKLLEALGRMVTQLDKVAKGEPTRLYKSLTGNLERLATMASGLAAIDDGKLSTLADDIHAKLLAHDVDAYKDNAALARSVGEAAKEVYQKIAGGSAGEPDPVDTVMETLDSRVEESMAVAHLATANKPEAPEDSVKAALTEAGNLDFDDIYY